MSFLLNLPSQDCVFSSCLSIKNDLLSDLCSPLPNDSPLLNGSSLPNSPLVKHGSSLKKGQVRRSVSPLPQTEGGEKTVKRWHTTGSVIYQWESKVEEEVQGRELGCYGKGVLVLKDAVSKKIIFEMHVDQWQDGKPAGNVKLTRWTTYPKLPHTHKTDQTLTYEGSLVKGKRQGHGKQTVVERYSDWDEHVFITEGHWLNDTLFSGTISTNNRTLHVEQGRLQQ